MFRNDLLLLCIQNRLKTKVILWYFRITIEIVTWRETKVKWLCAVCVYTNEWRWRKFLHWPSPESKIRLEFRGMPWALALLHTTDWSVITQWKARVCPIPMHTSCERQRRYHRGVATNQLALRAELETVFGVTHSVTQNPSADKLAYMLCDDSFTLLLFQ